MLKVRWVMSYRFCSKFHTLSSSAKILKILTWTSLCQLSANETAVCSSVFARVLLQIIETMPHTENVEDFLEKLGDFYEMIDDRVDGPVAQMMKQNRPQQKVSVKTSDVTNGVTSRSMSDSDSSEETSDTLHSHSDSVVGLWLCLLFCVVFSLTHWVQCWDSVYFFSISYAWAMG